MRANLEAFRRRRLVPRMLRDVEARDLRVRLLGRRPARAVAARAHRRAGHRPRGRRAGAGPRGLGAGRAGGALDRRLAVDRGGGGGVRRRAALVPALLVARPRRWSRAWWGGPSAPATGAIVVTVDNQLLAWRPRDLATAYLPFLQGIGIAHYLTDPVFRAQLERPPEEDLPAAVGRWASIATNPALDLGRPGLPARTYAAADPAQGHPAPRRRAPGGRRGPGRGRRLQPRRAPGRRRRRDAGRAARRGGGGARGLPGPVRQRHPHRRRHRQGAGPGGTRGAAGPALRLGPRRRRRGGRARRVAGPAGRPRPDAGPLRPPRRGRAVARRARLAQRRAADLAARGPGQLGGEVDDARVLVGRGLRP